MGFDWYQRTRWVLYDLMMPIPFALRVFKVNVRYLPLATTMPMQMHLLSIHVSIHMCPGRKWTLGTDKQLSPSFQMVFDVTFAI